MVKDKMFLLSKTEVKKYLPSKESRICLYEGINCWWWLRSPHSFSFKTASVICYDCLGDFGYDVSNDDCAVRPALHLNPDSLLSLQRTDENCVMFGNKEWLVLDEETGLLLLKDAVRERRFDEDNNNYEESEIRAYLNTELFNELFTGNEQEMIMDTIIDGELSYIDNEFDMTEEQLIEKNASSQEKDTLFKGLKRARVRTSLMESLSKRKNNPPARVLPFNPKESN